MLTKDKSAKVLRIKGKSFIKASEHRHVEELENENIKRNEHFESNYASTISFEKIRKTTKSFTEFILMCASSFINYVRATKINTLRAKALRNPK